MNDEFNRLIAKINAAKELQDKDFLRYSILKITQSALSYCQSDQFSVSSALPIARVICGLCEAGGTAISAIFKMQFYHQCPFTIPKLIETATGDAFYRSMGYNGKMGANQKVRVLFFVLGCQFFKSMWL